MIYTFRCLTCNNRFEIEVTSVFNFENRRASKPICPKCGSLVTRKIITNANIIFRGDGFYKNDTQE